MTPFRALASASPALLIALLSVSSGIASASNQPASPFLSALPIPPRSAAEILSSGKDQKVEISEPTNPATAPTVPTEATGTRSTSKTVEKPKKPKLETATFAGGCFWSMESLFERVPGVKTVVSGFSGGNVRYPSYEMVSTGETGHAETVEITFDPAVITYDHLLKIFFTIHDPTTLNEQGDDHGPQYRSAIFYQNEEQKQAALNTYKELTTEHAFRRPIVTELLAFKKFYPAEEYHQNYFDNNPHSQYSEYYIVPKLLKYRSKLHLNLN